MSKPDFLNDSNLIPQELRLSEEWRQQKAEGKRRQREYEGISDPKEHSYCPLGGEPRVMQRMIGTRTTSLDSASPAFNSDPVMTLYVESAEDQEALDRELRDLERDAAQIALAETVNYFPDTDPEERG